MEFKTGSQVGKEARMRRIFNNEGYCFLFGVSHQMTSKTILEGDRDISKAVELGIKGGANCICIGKGFLKNCIGLIPPDIGVLSYLPAYPAFSKINPYKLVVTSTVEESLIWGVDGIVLTVDLHSEDAPYSIEKISEFVKECDKYGLPLIVETEFPTFYETNEKNIKKFGKEYLMFAGRLASEIGADIITTNYAGDRESIEELIDYVKIPVLINGGSLVSPLEFLKTIEIASKAGISGYLISRNIIESKNPEKMASAIKKIFMEKISAQEAYRILK